MRRRGYSLIELILVIIVLSIGITTLLLVLRYSIVNSSGTHFNTIANWLCQEKLEEKLALRYDQGFTSSGLAIGTFTESSVSEFPNYTRVTQISNFDVSGESGNYKKIEITVSGESSPVDVTMSTVVSDY